MTPHAHYPTTASATTGHPVCEECGYPIRHEPYGPWEVEEAHTVTMYTNEQFRRDALQILNEGDQPLWVAVSGADDPDPLHPDQSVQVFGPYLTEQDAVAAIATADFTLDEFNAEDYPDGIDQQTLEAHGWDFRPLMQADKADAS